MDEQPRPCYCRRWQPLACLPDCSGYWQEAVPAFSACGASSASASEAPGAGGSGCGTGCGWWRGRPRKSRPVGELQPYRPEPSPGAGAAASSWRSLPAASSAISRVEMANWRPKVSSVYVYNTSMALAPASASGKKQAESYSHDKHTHRKTQCYDRPYRSGHDLLATQVRVMTSALSYFLASAKGSTRRNVVPRPISVTKSRAPLCKLKNAVTHCQANAAARLLGSEIQIENLVADVRREFRLPGRALRWLRPSPAAGRQF